MKRVVGIMYSVWHDGFLQTHLLKNNTSPWFHKKPFGPSGHGHWWGTPSFCESRPIPQTYRWTREDGSPNAELIDYHVDLLVKADVDFIFIDLTNGEQPDILKGAHAICKRYSHLVNKGKKVPGVVMWCMRPEATHIMHSEFYSKYDPRVFFVYQDKPLMLVRPYPRIDAPLDTSALPKGYTYRTMWALWSDPTIMWSMRNANLPYGGYRTKDGLEQMPVAFATQSLHMFNDADPSMQKGRRGRDGGKFFKECLDLVLTNKPMVMTVSTWNEWLSQNVSSTPGRGAFTDIFGPEFSGDCEPSVEHGRKYYDMLVAAIKEFKKL